MLEIHLKQPGFTYSVCVPFTKSKKRIQKLMQTGETNCIYKNDLDMAFGNYKDLNKRTQAGKFLRDKSPFEIANNRKYDGSQRGLASMVFKSF